jgi:arginase family enzyme
MTEGAVGDEPKGPADATRIPRYGGLATFARLPRLDEVSRADVVVVGVPFDAGVSYRPGARFGPGHIRASELLAILRSLADLHVTGADIVEVAPAYDHAEITGIAAAHVGYELLSAMALGKAAAGD